MTPSCVSPFNVFELAPNSLPLATGAQPPFEAFLHYERIQRAAELMDARAGSETEQQHWGGLIKRAFGGGKKIPAVPSDVSSVIAEVEREKGENGTGRKTYKARRRRRA